MTPLVCHRCEKNEAEEYPCCECGMPTCEDCFEVMTQFNAGRDLPCLLCVSKRERSDRAEARREDEREAAWQAQREQARARYRSPEAVAKRQQQKAARIEAERDARRKRDEATARTVAAAFVKGFGRFF